MATRIEAQPSDLYERDVYAWSKEQAALLRAKRFSDLDLEHLIEEIEDSGESLERSVRSRVRTIIEPRCPRPAPTPSTRSPAPGCRNARRRLA